MLTQGWARLVLSSAHSGSSGEPQELLDAGDEFLVFEGKCIARTSHRRFHTVRRRLYLPELDASEEALMRSGVGDSRLKRPRCPARPMTL